MAQLEHYDVAVIGAGIAGASVAAELAQAGARVAVLEQESQPGYHTTGRSAAIYSPIYGPAPIRALTRAARGFFDAPPEGFTDAALLSPVSATFIARADQLESLAALEVELAGASTVTRLAADEVAARLPMLRQGYAAAALWDSGTFGIDVAALHAGYLRQIKANGGALLTKACARGMRRSGAGWEISFGPEEAAVVAGIVVNAAGAWADEVGHTAGAEEIGLVPKRRTALIVAAPEAYETAGLPLIIDVEEQFYIKPEAGKLLISPANEDPMAPCDVQPDELDIAYCVDRIERAFDLSVRRIESSWAGLRSFVADKAPVAGFSQVAEGFYWLAGQGGYGIQSAPALAQMAAAEVLGRAIPSHILDEGLELAAIRPGRSGAARGPLNADN